MKESDESSLQSYLIIRTYKVRIERRRLNEGGNKVKYEVPQGSKLGSILYIISANDMLTILNNCQTFMCPDVIAIIVAQKNLEKFENPKESRQSQGGD